MATRELAIKKGLTMTEIIEAIYQEFGGDGDENIFDVSREHINIHNVEEWSDTHQVVTYEIDRENKYE